MFILFCGCGLLLREKYGRFFGLCQLLFSDFFDQFDGQGHCDLGGLIVANPLNPEERAMQDAEIFICHDCFALGDFCFLCAVRVADSKVFSGAVHGGGGSGVGHGRKLADFQKRARRIFVF